MILRLLKNKCNKNVKKEIHAEVNPVREIIKKLTQGL